jgi:hypothetical protein
MPAETSQPQSQSQSQSQARSGTSRSLWPTAEDEKERLYDSARAKVEKLQGSVARVSTPVCYLVLSSSLNMIIDYCPSIF